MLVTIIVITYNSESYIYQTLESVFKQTYKSIELIVSDDCSTDRTYDICGEWIESRRERFEGVTLTQTECNKGIAANYNHALRKARGKYVKYIAGDDMLVVDCIERFVQYTTDATKLYISGAERIENDGEHSCYCYSILPNRKAKRQMYEMLRLHPLIIGPGLFIERETLVALGGFDERYPMSEDYPIVMKFLSEGYECQSIDEPLVYWRMHSDSVSHSNAHGFKDSVRKAVLSYSWKYSWRYGLIFTPIHDWIDFWIPEHSGRGRLYKLIGYVMRCFDPIHIVRKITGEPPLIRLEY